jgi:hypothetical protein
MELIPKI